jgi:hypothetical protein
MKEEVIAVKLCQLQEILSTGTVLFSSVLSKEQWIKKREKDSIKLENNNMSKAIKICNS